MRLLTKFSAIVLLTLPAISWALPSDREKPINIEADNAQMDDQQGVTQYKGRAILTQGTLKIEGDIITFYYDENKQLEKAIATGKLAKYQQIQKPGESPVKAKALRMEYYANRDKIYLIGEGHVWQNGDEFSGNRIVYDIANNAVSANSAPVNVDGETHDRGRIHMIIQPPKKADKPTKKSKSTRVTNVASTQAPQTAPAQKKQIDSAATTAKTESTTPEKQYPEAKTTSRLNMRTGPGTGYQRVGTLDQFITVKVLTRQQGWAQVRGLIDGEPAVGWVNDYFLEMKQ
ncbi:MAG TPA: lipopolysaccharide transport periplasmic protein LptA [Methylophaga aminisulfidivorans]|uniref:Lipopolysaccharide export system protein LptA n=2 Tax=root TaxID=1 RepID=A0A7C1ZU50_9GAMM|nr:lipopolysaccharide transport periplasmic protein LptA [Methylophaga aminisulfidivorans]